MRIARDLGDTSLLLPEGIHRITELPYTIFEAIVTALGFLQFEELPKDEKPPKEIWLEGNLMRKHFKAVEEMRKAKYGLESTRMRDEPIDGPVSSNGALDSLYA